ncbi:hypothetical protein Scep_016449 [Stephania cephalantha]|uniref:Reverse transcriptase domain-containing protein n=1 Tax=Stephania cephalantha TaxID=152367 RepID=A0AAP0IMQ2_9MAGN
MERMSQAIHQAFGDGRWKAPTFWNAVTVSHLFFEDDLVLFAEASNEQVTMMNDVLNEFCACSGHKISKQKSQLLLSLNVSENLASRISGVMGISITKDLGRYFGVPIIHRRVTKGTYEKMLSKVASRVKG